MKISLNKAIRILAGIVILGVLTMSVPAVTNAQYYSTSGYSYYPYNSNYSNSSGYYYYPWNAPTSSYYPYSSNYYSYPYSASYSYYSYPSSYYPYNSYYGSYYGGYYTPISISCYPNTTSTYLGSYVTWTAYVTGGSGAYTYSWSGEGINYQNTNQTTAYYTTSGYKSATVSVTSGGQTTSRQCGQVYVNSYGYFSSPYYYPYSY